MRTMRLFFKTLHVLLPALLRHLRCGLLSAVLLPLLLSACRDNIIKEISPLPFNPYDTLTYDNSAAPPVIIDSNTFLGIHKYVMSVKCAQPACHDGAFEPDFRTPMSAYNTLVYAPVVKNNAANSFSYRVVPGDTTMSWLHERITTDDPVLGRMPLYDSLPRRQIKMINDWIAAGAKDIFGQSYAEPNTQPFFYGLVAYLTQNNVRIDTIRGSFFLNPFLVPANSEIKIWFGIIDDAPIQTLLAQPKVKFSTDPNGFDAVPAHNLSVQFTPFSSYALGGAAADYFASYTVNTALFNPGDLVYMRVYAKDPDHPFYTEIPSTSSPFYFQTYFSFIVQ